MPDPTRAQFDAAAKKVMETAPAGLSRDQFFALIDKELQGAVKPPNTLEMLTHKPEPNTSDAVPTEPDTFWGGFGKQMKKEYGGVPDALSHIAYPKTTSD